MQRIKRLAAATALVLSASVAVAIATDVPAQATTCSASWYNGGNYTVNNVFLNDGTPFYTGPLTSCSVISTYPAWSDAIYHCDYLNDNNVWWIHLKLTNWNRNGWAKSSTVRAFTGPVYFC